MNDESNQTPRCQRIRQHMLDHVAARLQAVEIRYQGRTDTAARDAIKKARERYQLDSVLEKGVKAAGGIAIASHIAKATHPDLKVKQVTNLAINFATLPKLKELGSHVLSTTQSLFDATGDGAYNRAAYDLYVLLDSVFEGKSLAAWLMAGDEDTLHAFTPGTENDEAPWLEVLSNKCPHPATDIRSKQVYWLTEPELACDDAAYLILAPLASASLMHQVYLRIHEDRFSKANQEAGQAKKKREMYNGVFRHYPGLAVQKMGGTKPQNISQLNSERGGVNYLLASLPPQAWKTSAPRLTKNAVSVFERLFGARPLVRQTVRELRTLLKPDTPPTMDTHLRREAMLDTLIDELVSMAGELQYGQPAGWTRDTERYGELAREEMLWLDPLRAELPDEEAFAKEWLWMDWPALVGQRFGAWLNAQLENKLPVGDVELREWKKELLTDGGFAEQLHHMRNKLDAPHYIPIRHTHDELVAMRGGKA